MNVLNDALSTAFACAWFSLFALPFAVIPPAILVLFLRASERNWSVSIAGKEEALKIPYWRLSLIGGICGECTAVCSLFFATEWSCFKGQQLCHDGQTGMVLILTVPLFSVLGSVFALLWTWITLRVPAERLYASILTYSGPRRILNRIIGLAVVFGIWMLALLLASAPFLQM